MDQKNLKDEIKYLISEDLFDEARKLAKEHGLKEMEIDTIGISNYYLAAQKAKKYGLYKKAMDFYSKMDPEDVEREILELHKISSKENVSKLLLLLNENLNKKQQIDFSDFANYYKIIPVHEYPPIRDLMNQN
jgi:hypothetical protein